METAKTIKITAEIVKAATKAAAKTTIRPASSPFAYTGSKYIQ